MTDKLIDKIGYDKLLHFFVAAWLVSECKSFGLEAAAIVWIVVGILSFVKERYLDNSFNYWDAWFSVLGGFLSLAIGLLQMI